MNHPESYSEQPRKKIRQIYSLEEVVSLRSQIQNLRNLGVRPIRFLHQLGMLIGESESADRWQDADFYSEPDIRITITEPLYKSYIATNSTIPWGVRNIEAHKVWRWSRGRGIRVAVIDTGISSYHPAIQRNYRGGVNILSPYYEPEDYNGHGTHVAGIIAGRSADLGAIGVAPRAYIYAVKAFNRRGSANLSDLLTAINWCVEKRMHIVNMSFGMDKVSESLRKAVKIANRKGIIMVAATGNQGKRMKIDYPANYPETISVGSVSSSGKISSFSNIGGEVDIFAPGEKIVSSWLDGSTKEMSGTSMAVPHVSGVIALLLHLNRYLTPEQIRYILVKTSKKVNDETRQYGIVNAYQAIRLSQKVINA